MEDLNLTLTFDCDRVRAMYYNNGNGHILTYKPTQKAIIYCLLVFAVNVLIYFVSFSNPGISFLIVIGAIILLIILSYTVYIINRYIKWKKDVEAFVKFNGQFKVHRLWLTSSTLELTQDETITIERWGNFKSAKLDDIQIILVSYNGPSFIFPASAMTSDEYLKMKDFISTKIRETNKVESQ